MGNRGRLDIIVDLLEICKKESIRTQLVYKGNLNFKILRKYLKILLDKNWVTDNEGTYLITSNGKRFLKKAKDVLSEL